MLGTSIQAAREVGGMRVVAHEAPGHMCRTYDFSLPAGALSFIVTFTADDMTTFDGAFVVTI